MVHCSFTRPGNSATLLSITCCVSFHVAPSYSAVFEVLTGMWEPLIRECRGCSWCHLRTLAVDTCTAWWNICLVVWHMAMSLWAGWGHPHHLIWLLHDCEHLDFPGGVYVCNNTYLVDVFQLWRASVPCNLLQWLIILVKFSASLSAGLKVSKHSDVFTLCCTLVEWPNHLPHLSDDHQGELLSVQDVFSRLLIVLMVLFKLL